MTEKRKRLTKKEREKVYAACGGRCAYCGIEIMPGNFVVEHVEPLHIGGEDSMVNMLPSCKSCNHYKHTMPPEKFRGYLQDITKRLRRDNITYQIALRYGLVKETETPVIFYYEKIKMREE